MPDRLNCELINFIDKKIELYELDYIEYLADRLVNFISKQYFGR